MLRSLDTHTPLISGPQDLGLDVCSLGREACGSLAVASFCPGDLRQHRAQTHRFIRVLSVLSALKHRSCFQDLIKETESNIFWG